MAIEVAGKKPVGKKKVKIVRDTEVEVPDHTEDKIREILDFLPAEHIRGIDRIILVDFIDDTGLQEYKGDYRDNLPYSYFPAIKGKVPSRSGRVESINKPARMEISMMKLINPLGKFHERWMAKSSFNSSLASALFVMVGQHYYLTLQRATKKQDQAKLQTQIQRYAEQNLKKWGEEQSDKSWRGRLFKPIRPYMERWARWLNKRAAQNK